MRILGVDPGTQVVGYGCLELRSDPARSGGGDLQPMAHRVGNLVRGGGRGEIEVLVAGTLRLGRSADAIEQRLRRLAEGLRLLFRDWRPDRLALEEAYFGKSVQSALRIGEARGVILAEACAAGVRIEQFPPARIKRVVTGSGQAGKDQVADMVRRTLRLREPPETLDVTDALAVGLCCIESRRDHFARQRVDSSPIPEV
jgi:crossover junction endodeoxyribonuclease RuvC